LRWNQAGHDFLGNILGTCSQEIFELDRAELLDNSALLTDALVETFFELIKFSFLFVKILYEASSSFLHFVKTAFKSFVDPNHRPIDLSSILRVPNIVGDKLFNAFLPGVLEHLLFSKKLELVHESIYVFDQNVVSCDQHFLLLLAR